MSQLRCYKASALIQARNAGLPASSALLLEEHLAHCGPCSEQARALDHLQMLSDVGAQPLPPAARRRALLNAFEAAERPPQLAAAATAWFAPSAFGAAAAIALVAFAVSVRPVLEAAPDRVVAGALARTGSAVPRGGELETEADAGATLALAHARVELRPATRARWERAARLVRLEQGSVAVEVDPVRRASFAVETPRFRAQVLGTRFEVTLSSVRVTRGRVQVLAPDGAPLALLGAGESYEAGAAPPAAATARSATLPAGAAASSASSPAGAAARSASSPPAGTAARSASSPAGTAARSASSPAGAATSSATPPAAANAASADPAASVALKGRSSRMTASAANKRLDEAREALARHDLSSARAGIDEVLAGAPGRREQAEAFTLRAESALVAGDLAAAAAGYAFVAERFEGLPAAENALFAAARIDADRLRGPAAAKGLEQYLSRYPNGRFVKEAASRLRDLRARSGSDP